IEINTKYFPAYYFILHSYDLQKKEPGLYSLVRNIFTNDKRRKDWVERAEELFDSPVLISDIGVYKYSMLKYMQ
ncbi:MAG: hypothetical protein ACLFT4_11140, partial [Bacteroidales bacterium]